MKFEFESYKNKQGFRGSSKYPICNFGKVVSFNNTASKMLDLKKQILWGIADDKFPCFKLCDNGRKITILRRAGRYCNCGMANAPKFIMERFHGKYIIEKVEDIFVLRKYEEEEGDVE